MIFFEPAKVFEQSCQSIDAILLDLGRNKKQELVRLVFEIARKENHSPEKIVRDILRSLTTKKTYPTFSLIKKHLLERRFPHSFRLAQAHQFYLPRLDISENNSVERCSDKAFYPAAIFIDEKARKLPLTQKILSHFPRAHRVLFDKNTYRDYLYPHIHQIKAYNERTKRLYLVCEEYDFIKSCPCTPKACGCGYAILNIGFGCPFECSYCYLQHYTNRDGMVIPVNIETFLEKLDAFLSRKKRPMRIGTGEFTDSLVFDQVTGIARILIDYFASNPHSAVLELKTKSVAIDGIVHAPVKKNTVIAWSLNPQRVIDSDEWFTTTLAQRLSAARQCVEAGYRVGFHFDPIIYSKHWRTLYKKVIKDLLREIPAEALAWISLGTFRFPPKLKTIIEQRFPSTKILDGELLLGYDKKLRYTDTVRIDIYRTMVAWIRDEAPEVWVYLCMESQEVWQAVFGKEYKSFCSYAAVCKGQ